MGYTTDNRFQISCSVCGYLYSERTLEGAKRTARLAERKHFEPDEFVEIYDIMAHIDKPELYTSDGSVTKVRID